MIYECVDDWCHRCGFRLKMSDATTSYYTIPPISWFSAHLLEEGGGCYNISSIEYFFNLQMKGSKNH